MTVLAGVVHAGEVITEIRFRENGFIARPGEHSFIIIDIRGEEHTIPVLKGEKFVVSSSLDYRGPRQYSTEYPQGFIYRKMKISGEYYQCFYVPQSFSRSLIEREINKVIQGND